MVSLDLCKEYLNAVKFKKNYTHRPTPDKELNIMIYGTLFCVMYGSY